jgi:hypothetical protein
MFTNSTACLWFYGFMMVLCGFANLCISMIGKMVYNYTNYL